MNNRCREEWQALLLAFGLLTRLPVPRPGPVSDALMGRSLHWYPVAGLVIGSALMAAGYLSLPPLLLSVLVVAVWVALTGALHLDGLADCADAWVGGMGDRDRTLEILKDPASGPVGVTALVLTLLLKVAAVETLLTQSASIYLLLVPVVARTLLLPCFLLTPYVRAGGMGDVIARFHSGVGVAVSVAIVAAASWLLVPFSTFLCLLAAATLLFICWRRAMVKRLGGFTGDGAGALVELAETLLLLVAAAIAGSAV